MDITLGHDEDLIRFGDLVPIFKVTTELNGLNFSVGGWGISIFSENTASYISLL